MEQQTTNLTALDDKEGRLANRASIEEYEQAMKDLCGSERGEMDDINDRGLQEYHIGGAYTRRLFIPKGISIVSKLWNRDRLWIIPYGKVAIRTEQGQQIIEGPFEDVAPFGSKVALVALENTLWYAITGVPETDKVEECEDIVTAKKYDDLKYPWDLLENEK